MKCFSNRTNCWFPDHEFYRGHCTECGEYESEEAREAAIDDANDDRRRERLGPLSAAQIKRDFPEVAK